MISVTPKKKPTMNDIARTLGISQAAVSYVLNDAPQSKLMNVRTREKIWAEARRLRYTPHAGARAMRLHKSNTIALFVSAFTIKVSTGMSDIIMSVAHAASQRGYRVLLESSISSMRQSQDVVAGVEQLIMSRQCDGAVFTGPMHEDIRGDLIHEFDFPAVFLGRSEDDTLDSVDTDNRTMGCDMTNHLLTAGRRRLAILTGSMDYTYQQDRHAGYLDALGAAGLTADPSLHVAVSEDWMSQPDDEEITDAVDRLWQLDEKPDAIISGVDDLMASAILRVLRRRGVSVPDEVALTGCNNSRLSTEIRPTLTTADLHTDRLGERAANLLIDRIEKPGSPPRHEIIPHTLIVRDSTRSR